MHVTWAGTRILGAFVKSDNLCRPASWTPGCVPVCTSWQCHKDWCNCGCHSDVCAGTQPLAPHWASTSYARSELPAL